MMNGKKLMILEKWKSINVNFSNQDIFYSLVEEDLSNIPFHDSVNNIIRFVGVDTPYHIAIHKIVDSSETPSKYVSSHCHDAEELNILLSDDNSLTYKFEIDSNVSTVSSPAIIKIPSKVSHSANYISGTGYYICIILTNKYEVSSE